VQGAAGAEAVVRCVVDDELSPRPNATAPTTPPTSSATPAETTTTVARARAGAGAEPCTGCGVGSTVLTLALISRSSTPARM
jgi:hypothetical protein